MQQNGLTVQVEKLFWDLAAEARTFSTSDNEGMLFQASKNN